MIDPSAPAALRCAQMWRALFVSAILAGSVTPGFGQLSSWQPDPTVQQDYVLHRSSSSDPIGANQDSRPIEPGATLTVLDVDGPGVVSHLWFTATSTEPFYLKLLVLRMYWDNEKTPSVETPLGDFFGLGLGVPYSWQSEMLSVGNDRAMNSFFPMPFAHHARVTVTNEGKIRTRLFFYNIDYRSLSHKIPRNTLYFHAVYHQAQPHHGWTNDWVDSLDPNVVNNPNLDGKDNYVWMNAAGHGQFIGVTMSVLQNQDGWWGEGDDMFFVDGSKVPSIAGTGAEDYFLGAWGFGGKAFSFQLYGAPVMGNALPGSAYSAYRFHLDSPIPFKSSFKATIEDGSANHRSDNFYSVAYWYQSEPHGAREPLPQPEQRVPTIQAVGGPGNSGPSGTGVSHTAPQ